MTHMMALSMVWMSTACDVLSIGFQLEAVLADTVRSLKESSARPKQSVGVYSLLQQ